MPKSDLSSLLIPINDSDSNNNKSCFRFFTSRLQEGTVKGAVPLPEKEIPKTNRILSFNEGASWILNGVWPTALTGLLIRDFTVYALQGSENSYGANFWNILFGFAPNEESWATQFGSYFPTEIKYWSLFITLFGGMLAASGIQMFRNRHRSNELVIDIKDENINNLKLATFAASGIQIFRHQHRSDELVIDNKDENTNNLKSARLGSNLISDTIPWLVPFGPLPQTLSHFEFAIRYDNRLEDRMEKFEVIEKLATNHHYLVRYHALSALSRIADSFYESDLSQRQPEFSDEEKQLKEIKKQALETIKKQASGTMPIVLNENASLLSQVRSGLSTSGNFYAKYLLWKLGKAENVSIPNKILHALFWFSSLGSLFFKLRLIESLVYKLYHFGDYLYHSAQCSDHYVMVPEIGDYDCVVCDFKYPDNYIYYPYRYSAQGCLNGYLGQDRDPDNIIKVINQLPPTYEDIDFSRINWIVWPAKKFKEVLDAFRKGRTKPIGRFKLSSSTYNPIIKNNPKIVDDGKFDYLAAFANEVGVKQLDMHNQGVGSLPIIKMIEAINGTITEEIDISNTNSEDDVVEALSDILPYTPHLRSIKANSNSFLDYGIGRLMKGAENSTSLADIDVSNNPFGVAGLQSTSDSLPKTSIKSLNISSVDLSQANLGSFGKAAAQTPTLEEVYLASTNINGPQLNEFSSGAKTSNLRLLDISDNGSLQGQDVSQFIKNMRNSTLTEVKMGGLRITDPDLQNIGKDLPDTAIEHLEIPRIQITPGGFCQFVPSLNQTQVKTLQAGNNALGDQGAECAAQTFSQPGNKVENWDLSGNQITKRGGQKVFQTVPHSGVKKLILSDNPLGGTIGADAEDAMKQLESLILENANIDSDGANAMATGLPNATHLKHFSINGNPVGNEADKEIITNLIEPIPGVNISKTEDSKAPNDFKRAIHKAKRQTNLESIGIANTGLQDDGVIKVCTFIAPGGIPLDKTQMQNNSINSSKVDIENCQTSDATKLLSGNLGKYLGIGFLFYKLIDYFFTDNRVWILDDKDQKQIEQYKTELKYLENQHEPQKTSAAAKNPHLNYLFEAITNLCYAVTATLANVEKTKELSDTILKDVNERLMNIERHIQKISQYNKEMKIKRNKERCFEERCNLNGETGIIITQRNVLTGKVTQEFSVAADSKTIAFLKEKEKSSIAENKTKFSQFTKKQQFWQLQDEAEKLHTDVKYLETENTTTLQLGK